MTLPKLVGSEKQVAWANKLRDKAVQSANFLAEYINEIDLQNEPYNFYEVIYEKEKVLSYLTYGIFDNKSGGDYFRKKYREVEPIEKTNDEWRYRQAVYVIKNLIEESNKIIETEETAKFYIEHRV